MSQVAPSAPVPAPANPDATAVPGAPATIIVIDDDRAMRLSCEKILAKSGFRVQSFESGSAGLEAVSGLKPDMAVVDLKMPGISGMEVIARLHEIDPQIVIVVITGYATIDTAVEAMKSGAYDFVPKPFSPDELRLIVKRGLEHRRLVLESQQAEMERELLRRRFVTFVSHQLQTPLVAIHQYLDVLRRLDNPDPAKLHEWLDRCLTRTDEIQAIIKDWLTLAKVEGGQLVHQRAKVDLTRTIAEILKTYEVLAAAERITLENRMPEEGCPVVGDQNGLSVLFDNLVVNAIKYNRPGGKVAVSVERTPAEAVVSVADTGIGIPEKYRKLLFGEFFRIQDAKKTPGTGLGLAIAKRVASEMGGSISVDSEVDVGSTFRVRLLAWREPDEAQETGRA
ncbi:MAG: hybrid sensor histidine kinase/response regulator [Bryobacterales bacterium]|nr:hybrid sensor histidine kinase/response regulator [Bryobacterales bacterium]